MAKELRLEEHGVTYREEGEPIWFVVAFSENGSSLNILVVPGKDEEEARSRVNKDQKVIKCSRLYSLLDRARIIAGFIRGIE